MEKQLGWACKLGGIESLGITRVGQTVLAKLTESQIWHQPAGCVVLWGRVQKRVNGLCLPFCLRESCHPVLTLMPDTSVPLQFHPVCHWCLTKSMCGIFKRNCLGFLWYLPLTQSLLVFAARCYGTYLPGTGTLGWGAWRGAVTPCSRIFIHRRWMWDQPILCLCPSFQLDVVSLIP